MNLQPNLFVVPPSGGRIALALLFSLAVCTALPAKEATPSCCEHKEDADAATAESIYQLDATWTTQLGKPMTLADLKGRPVLITMGYATCKFACPRLATDLLGIEKKLTAEERANLAVVFVSIDPERDTPEQIKSFFDQYKVDHQRWFGLRGDEDAILELSVALGIRYRKTTETDFAHSNIIALLSPTGEIVHRQEGLGTDPADLITALRKPLEKP
ncbi:SCO family protein [Haloferula sp.]|uniref:SCO family protein n=1 Tax=Haloferula sp. TaxID=2497595 RepID=UPI003C737CDB